ncbi:MAG: 2'-5' RNA ligase family protein [Janthinobacterium lividum]
MTSPAPLILTLTLDDASQAFFDEQRRRYFPPSRNYLGAHLTLFHALPGDQEAAIAAYLSEEAARQTPLELAVASVKFMGRGVMYSLDCPPLGALHRRWQRHWQPLALTAQDQQGLHPHITVQNKVDPAEARTLHAELAAGFEPWAALGTGLALWAYRGGPWEARQQWPFGMSG